MAGVSFFTTTVIPSGEGRKCSFCSLPPQEEQRAVRWAYHEFCDSEKGQQISQKEPELRHRVHDVHADCLLQYLQECKRKGETPHCPLCDKREIVSLDHRWVESTTQEPYLPIVAAMEQGGDPLHLLLTKMRIQVDVRTGESLKIPRHYEQALIDKAFYQFICTQKKEVLEPWIKHIAAIHRIDMQEVLKALPNNLSESTSAFFKAVRALPSKNPLRLAACNLNLLGDAAVRLASLNQRTRLQDLLCHSQMSNTPISRIHLASSQARATQECSDLIAQYHMENTLFSAIYQGSDTLGSLLSQFIACPRVREINYASLVKWMPKDGCEGSFHLFLQALLQNRIIIPGEIMAKMAAVLTKKKQTKCVDHLREYARKLEVLARQLAPSCPRI